MSFQTYERAQLAKLRNAILQASATWDPAATAATQGAEVSTTIAVPGAAVGDTVLVGHTGFLGAVAAELEASVSAADTVKVRIINTTAAAVDVPTGTLRVTVIKPIPA
jgi:hypothetical protein